MADLTPSQRRALAGLLGTAGHAVGHAWLEDGVEDIAVQDALEVAAMLGWSRADMEALWSVALSLCASGLLDA